MVNGVVCYFSKHLQFVRGNRNRLNPLVVECEAILSIIHVQCRCFADFSVALILNIFVT